jgi:hypothetical protein
MAIKKESGGKTPMAKAASKSKPRKVVVDPSSALPKIKAAKKVMQNSIGGDYASSRAMDRYAKKLKKYGVTVNPAKDNPYYVPAKSKTSKGR